MSIPETSKPVLSQRGEFWLLSLAKYGVGGLIVVGAVGVFISQVQEIFGGAHIYYRWIFILLVLTPYFFITAPWLWRKAKNTGRGVDESVAFIWVFTLLLAWLYIVFVKGVYFSYLVAKYGA